MVNRHVVFLLHVQPSAIWGSFAPASAPTASTDDCSALKGDHTFSVFFISFVGRPFLFTAALFLAYSLFFWPFSIAFHPYLSLFKSFPLRSFVVAPQRKKQRTTKRQPPPVASLADEEKFITLAPDAFTKINLSIGILWWDGPLKMWLISAAVLLFLSDRTSKISGH